MNWKKFRKKPVVIKAVRWNPDTADEIEWPESPDGRVLSWCEGRELEIGTLEGTMIAHPGDWVVCGIQNELYPVRDDIFRATYEEVDD
jgi:hypothetical protein